MPAPYIDRIGDFVGVHPDRLLGRLTTGLAEERLDTNPDTAWSWTSEISQLQRAFKELLESLPAAAQWVVLLEYVLPGVGQRVDCVLLASDLIFVIEYKAGTTATARSALRQAQEYAMNLADFHEESRHRTAIPIALGTFKSPISLDLTSRQQGAAVGPEDLSKSILWSFKVWGGKGDPIDPLRWNASRYFPVPTIIQAASKVYAGHDVRELAHSRAGTDNLEATQRAIIALVAKAREEGRNS